MTTMTTIAASAERLVDLVDRRADEFRRVIGDGGLGGRRAVAAAMLGKGLAHLVDDVERIGGRGRVDADEDGLQPVEDGRGIDRFRAELDLRDIAEPNQGIAAGRDDQIWRRPWPNRATSSH